jgi:hypothetical protein
MRAWLVALFCAVSPHSSAGAQQMQAPGDSERPVIGNADAPWRSQNSGAPLGDRAIAHACLEGGAKCENVVQAACAGAAGDLDTESPAFQRQCDWRAMAAWEDEIIAMLADLRGKLDGRDLNNLNDSETAWERSMLADIGLGMDYYAGGTISGPIGAHIRARATAQRAAYLYEMQQMVGE